MQPGCSRRSSTASARSAEWTWDLPAPRGRPARWRPTSRHDSPRHETWSPSSCVRSRPPQGSPPGSAAATRGASCSHPRSRIAEIRYGLVSAFPTAGGSRSSSIAADDRLPGLLRSGPCRVDCDRRGALCDHRELPRAIRTANLRVRRAQSQPICRSRGAVLATRNLPDFDGTGIDIIDPWAPAKRLTKPGGAGAPIARSGEHFARGG